MASKNIIRKRSSTEPQNDNEPSPSRIRFNDKPKITDIFEWDASKHAIPDNKKITFNSIQMQSQNFGLPKPIMDYLLKASNAKVMKKFHRTCKYIYQRNPMCIVDEMNAEGMEIENKWHQNYVVPAAINNIWVLNKLKFEKFDSIIEKIVRSDAQWVDLPKCQISMKLFDILSDAKRIYSWNSEFTQIISNYDTTKNLSIEDLFFKLSTSSHTR